MSNVQYVRLAFKYSLLNRLLVIFADSCFFFFFYNSIFGLMYNLLIVTENRIKTLSQLISHV